MLPTGSDPSTRSSASSAALLARPGGAGISADCEPTAIVPRGAAGRRDGSRGGVRVLGAAAGGAGGQAGERARPGARRA